MNGIIPALVLTGTLSFGLGYGVAWFSAEDVPGIAPSSVTLAQDEKVTENELQQLFAQGPNQGEGTLTRPEPKQISQISAMIASASPEKVDHYLKQAFPEADLSQIKDKKRFAQRAVEEFAQTQNDEQDNLAGQVVVAVEEYLGAHAQKLENINKSQYLFAHLDTFNQVEHAQQIFIRWINRDTGEVLFFSPQQIVPDKAKNWVSFSPAKGWTAGTYDVRYYQMKDDLQPIAQTSFQILSIAD